MLKKKNWPTGTYTGQVATNTKRNAIRSMKNVLLILSVCVLFAACEKDEEPLVITSGPTVEAPFSMLHYDAANMDAPLLPSGVYESAARFTADQVSNFQNGEMLKVWFYLKQLPQDCEIRIYEANAGASTPGPMLYSHDYSAEMEAGRWNSHDIITPITLQDKDIWVSLRYTHANDTRSVGCDPGPAVDNGDKMWTDSGGNWITLRQFDGTNINWNIRAVIHP